MIGLDVLVGKVVGPNLLRSNGRTIACWTNSMQSAMAPQPLDLSSYEGKTVQVHGRLHSDLWEAEFDRVVPVEGQQKIKGKVVSSNIIEGPKGQISCYRHRMNEAYFLPLSLLEYMGQTITVEGELHGTSLYRAQIVDVEKEKLGGEAAKEAKSLNDLLLIRAANRETIERVNGNLGTALGFKWTNNQQTNHPCVIIFVPQKTAPILVPDSEKAPEVLEGRGGMWCLTDVVTGGKAPSLDETDPQPELSEQNQQVIAELQSGRIGLIGGIQLAFYEDGIRDWDHAFVGTAGLPVRHRDSGRVGFLTNQHVADAPGRRIYHPSHLQFPIGVTNSVLKHVDDRSWYEGVIDEERSFVRCDCGFVEIDEHLARFVEPRQHVIGTTGPLLSIEQNAMDIIGQKVIGVGRTRGVQRGTVVAYAYEFSDEDYSIYTDLLIIGEDGNAFSWKGDSGKIIVTDDDDHRPVALLWGGWQERLRHGREQENWTYAIDLRKVLDRLNLELLDAES